MTSQKLSSLPPRVLDGTELVYVVAGGSQYSGTVQEIVDLVPSLADGDYGDITVSGLGTVFTIDALAVTLSKLAASVQTSLGLADTSTQPADNISTLTNDSGFITSTGVTYANLNANGDVGTGAAQVAQGDHLHAGVYEPADATILKDADIGVTVQAFDATILVDADIGVNVQAFDADLSSWAAITRAAGFDTFAATPSSANLAALITDETGTAGSLVFSNAPDFTGDVDIASGDIALNFNDQNRNIEFAMGAANFVGFLRWTKSALDRWTIGTTGNSGVDDLYVARYNDAGAFQGNAWRIARNTGAVITNPPASDDPDADGEFLIEGTSNTALTFKFKGSDSTIRTFEMPLGSTAEKPLLQGTHTIPVLAGAMTARTTNGAAPGLTESSTNKIMVRSLDFDPDTDEFAQITIPMPKNWDEGTVTVQFIWTATATGNVIWGAQGVALGDDDAVDSAFGTAQTVTDGVTAANDIMESAFTSAITIAGTPGAEDIVVFQFYRDADAGGDTCTVDAKLLGVRIKYTVNAGNDV